MSLRQEMEEALCAHILHSAGNVITAEQAFGAEDIGQRMFDAPLVAVGAADDPLWQRMQQPDAVGALMKTPREWLPGARSVIAFFAPFTPYITEGNSADPRAVGTGWMTAYRHGDAFLAETSHFLEDWLRRAGYEALEPYRSEAFVSVYSAGSNPKVPSQFSYTSNWSVRHAAYICGLGTFGLSRGLITRKGVAGRFDAVITTAPLPVDERPYQGRQDYCIMCGKCARNCPAGAIDLKTGKDHEKCQQWLSAVKRECGCGCCGKCQVDVPCQRRAPGACQKTV